MIEYVLFLYHMLFILSSFVFFLDVNFCFRKVKSNVVMERFQSENLNIQT